MMNQNHKLQAVGAGWARVMQLQRWILLRLMQGQGYHRGGEAHFYHTISYLDPVAIANCTPAFNHLTPHNF